MQTETDNLAADTCAMICELLRNRGWEDVKISHYRLFNEPTDLLVDGRVVATKDRDLIVDTAIEVGYVTGECTVRFNRLGGGSGQVDMGTYHYMRGIGPAFVESVNEAIKNLESMTETSEDEWDDILDGISRGEG